MIIIYFPEGKRLCEPCLLKHTYATSAGMVCLPWRHRHTFQRDSRVSARLRKHTHAYISRDWLVSRAHTRTFL